MTDPVQTYVINEFSTGEWNDRPEYASEDPDWHHIANLHRLRHDFVEFGKCGDTDYWYFLHKRIEASFQFYLYQANRWVSLGGDVRNAEPFMWIYGTTFDGVRECSGAQNFTGNLPEMAEALKWIHEFCGDRWPDFKEWYNS